MSTGILKVKSGNGWITIPAVAGPAGPAGPGLPSGGTAGQVPVKASSTDYDMEWSDNVTDVQVNGTSVVTNGVANVPVAGDNFGVVKTDSSNGIYTMDNGKLRISSASLTGIKLGSDSSKPIVPTHQHESIFYGLAKAAGDTTQSASSNAVGAYTNEALAKIQKMLGVYREWELIKEVEVSEDSANILINTDTNGNSFSLKKLYARVWLKPSTTGANSSLYTEIYGKREDGVEVVDFGLSSIQLQTSNRYVDYIVECIDGFNLGMARFGSNPGNTNNLQSSSGEIINHKKITGFKIKQASSSATLIPNGTKIILYGIKQ